MTKKLERLEYYSYLGTSERDNTSFPYADGLNRELRVRQHADSLRLVGGIQTPTLFSFSTLRGTSQ